jgi:hypothetical protein
VSQIKYYTLKVQVPTEKEARHNKILMQIIELPDYQLTDATSPIRDILFS